VGVVSENLQGRRYLGEIIFDVVHDSSRWHATCGPSHEEELRTFGVGFEPDTLETAIAEGYDLCPFCVSGIDPDLWMRVVVGDSPDEPPPSFTRCRLSPPRPRLSAGEAVSMEDEADSEEEAA
jgi:hypothetical protein